MKDGRTLAYAAGIAFILDVVAAGVAFAVRSGVLDALGRKVGRGASITRDELASEITDTEEFPGL